MSSVDTALRARYTAAIGAVNGSAAVARHVHRLSLPRADRRRAGRLRVIGIGKVALAMARGLAQSCDIDEGLLIVKEISGDIPRGCRVLCGDHPVPGEQSLATGLALQAFLAERPSKEYSDRDAYIVLLSGGASALVAAPATGVSLADKQRLTREWLASGMSIEEINRQRRKLSQLKGGGLARLLSPARFVTLAISDVPQDDPAVIGSAPTWIEGEDPLARYSREKYFIVGSLTEALRAAANSANNEPEVQVVELGRCLDGEVETVALSLSRRLQFLHAQACREQRVLEVIAGGEPTVQLRGAGRGGRAQQLALRLAVALQGLQGARWLIAGTDGNDGPTDAAGGFADGMTVGQLSALGIDAETCLAANDAYPALQALGDLFFTPPTETNVADVLLARLDGRR